MIEGVDHVEQRLRPWWEAEGERSVLTRARELQATAKRNRMAQAAAIAWSSPVTMPMR